MIITLLLVFLLCVMNPRGYANK